MSPLSTMDEVSPNMLFHAFVKNTFLSVEIDEEEDDEILVQRRRSSSIPPSMRITRSADNKKGTCEDNSTGYASSTKSSDANSTHGFEDEVQSGSDVHATGSLADTSDTEATEVDDWIPPPPVSQPRLQDMLPEAPRIAIPILGTGTSVVKGRILSYEPICQHAQQTLPMCTQPMLQTCSPSSSLTGSLSPAKRRLNPSAKVFSPQGVQTPTTTSSSPVSSPASLIGSAWRSSGGQDSVFAQRCGNIIDTMRQALIGTQHVMGVEVRRGDNCWSVAVQLPRDILPEDTLDSAKHSLLESAGQSSNVYVLGYSANPFVTTPFGFTAFLCNVKDNASACWDMFATGSCRRGNRCTWEHPEQRARVSVIIKRVSDF